mgnify:FL=1
MIMVLYKLNWQNISIDNIIGGRTSDGVRYLSLFLKDYAREFNKVNLNASCNNCIRDYHNQYIKKFTTMANESDYQLHQKYENIRLFGTSVVINNNNITNSLGKKLLESKGEKIFSKLPKKVSTAENEPATVTPKKRTRIKKS